MPLPNQAISSNQEGRNLLAIQAIKLRPIKSIQAATVSYNVTHTTLYNRIHIKLS
jgi:hypothetical protein